MANDVQKAPVDATGGAGFEYEDQVASRFLIDLLGGRCQIAPTLGSLASVRWQASESGWLFDDLVLGCQLGSEARDVGISIKKGRYLTQAGFPEDFVYAAWRQWLGLDGATAVKGAHNLFGLVVGRLAEGVESDWERLLTEALGTSTDPSRIVARLAATKGRGAQSSKLQRTLFSSLRCPSRLIDHLGGDNEEMERVRLLVHVRVVRFDFASPSSRKKSEALDDCRQLLTSGDAHEAQALWTHLMGVAGSKRAAGGTISLVELLDELRPHFQFRDHPEFAADWRTLDQRSQEAMQNVRTEIPGLGRFPQLAVRQRVNELLNAGGFCMLVGESGTGKSALAKTIAIERTSRVCWLDASALEDTTSATVRKPHGIGSDLESVLLASPLPCVLVLDAIENFSGRDLAQLGRVLASLAQGNSAPATSVLFTIRPNAVQLVLTALGDSGMRREQFDLVQVLPPSEIEIAGFARALPKVHWAALNPGVRSVLANLKVLDWMSRAIQDGAVPSSEDVISVSALIDWLWRRWVEQEGDEDSYSRSHLLIRVGCVEAESLARGVARMRLDHTEQRTLQALERAELVRRREERVYFSHDLLGDWARCRHLIAEGPGALLRDALTLARPRWHAAVRLYGQWLIERDENGIDAWFQLLSGLDAATEAATVVHDLLLDSILVASDSQAVLEKSWSHLVTNGGSLLKRLLDRFLFIATVPDPQIAHIVGSVAQAEQLEHLFRVPIASLWGPVLRVLATHLEDVVRLASSRAARVCRLWLRATPQRLQSDHTFPGRGEAADVALAITHELQAQSAELVYGSRRGDEAAFEALLYAAPDLPEEVAQSCLSLAQRAPPHRTVTERAERAAKARRIEEASFEQDNPRLAEEQRSLLTTVISRGPMRKPWPDGPLERVHDSFRSACLDSVAFRAFIGSAPDAAREVLLAVCIEEPQEENPYRSLNERSGTVDWQGGFPPLYSRGPFLSFLQQEPSHGLSVVLTLVNFATERHVDENFTLMRLRGEAVEHLSRGLDVDIGDGHAAWLGDDIVCGWAWKTALAGNVVSCALMALEKWLYDQLDAHVDVTSFLDRIRRESRSLAFAGLLVDVAKRHPRLLFGPLQFLLRNPDVYELDLQESLQRSAISDLDLLPWVGHGAQILEVARAWFSMPHRGWPLRDLASSLLLGNPELRTFFDDTRAAWLKSRPNDQSVRLLAERLNPANYRLRDEPEEDGQHLADFQWPAEIQDVLAPELEELSTSAMISGLPLRCRQLLEGGEPPPDEVLCDLWNTANLIESLESSGRLRGDHPFIGPTDGLCGAAAVFLTHGHAWQELTPDRERWCRRILEEALEAPATAVITEHSIGHNRRDSFLAYCGVALSCADERDALGRRLIAVSVTAQRYAVTELVMALGSERRTRMRRSFGQMQTLAINWAGTRGLWRLARSSRKPTDAYTHERSLLVEQFVNDTISADPPSVVEFDLRERERRSQLLSSNEAHGEPAIDLAVIKAGFAWIAKVGNAELGTSAILLNQLARLSLERATKVDKTRSRTHLAPSEFDTWVLRMLGTNPLTEANESAIWRAVLDLPAAAHFWVEMFCAAWFETGSRRSQDPESFATAWSAMIRYALSRETWERSWEHGKAAVALLGFTRHGQALARENGAALAFMVPAFTEAADRWFGMLHVIREFATFAASIGANPLLAPGLQWLRGASTQSHIRKDDEVREAVVGFLDACWRYEGHRIEASQDARDAFIELATCAAATGSHSAAALLERVRKGA